MPGVVDEMRLGFALVGPDAKVFSACPRYAEMVGLTQAECIGLNLADCTHPDDLKSNVWMLEHALIHGGVFDLRKRYLRSDGSVLWVEQHVLTLGLPPAQVMLITVHPVRCTAGDVQVGQAPEAVAQYVVDLSRQLAAMAVAADLPVTTDLLELASRTAAREANLDEKHKQPPTD